MKDVALHERTALELARLVPTARCRAARSSMRTSRASWRSSRARALSLSRSRAPLALPPIYADLWREDPCLAAAEVIEAAVGQRAPVEPVMPAR